MKLTNLHYRALMTKSTFKEMYKMGWVLVIRVNLYIKEILITTSKISFEAYCFNFQYNQDSFFLNLLRNVRSLA